MPTGTPAFIQDSRTNLAFVAGQHQLHTNETYPTILPSYWQSITAESGGTRLESMECARLVIGSVSGNHMMFIGGLDEAAPFSGRGIPLYPGLDGEREMFIENANRVSICASFSGEMIYYMGYINGSPTTISSTTQGSQPNNEPPFLVRTDPLDGEHNVEFQGSGNTFISIFNENIASGTADIDSYSIRISGNFDSVLSGTVSYYAPEDENDRTRIQFISASGQLRGSSYYNVFIGQRIADDFGSALPATLTWSFITAGIDDSPMFLKTFTPLSGTVLAPFSQQITATFSKRISGTINSTGYTNNVFLWNDNTPNTGVSGVTILDSEESGRKLVFTPIALLQPGTLYRYAITGVTDLFGVFANPQSGMAFSTGPADTAGPIISGLSPNGAYPSLSGILVNTAVSGNVPTLTNVVVTFNERLSGIPGGIISGQVISLINSGAVGTNLSGVISLDQSGRILTFDPVSELISGTAYRINISGVMDVNGNVMSQTAPPRSGIAFRSWVDPDVAPPIVNSITPLSGSLGVALASNVVVTFNETLSGTHPANPYTTIIAIDLSGTGAVAGNTTTNSSGTVVTFDPTADLSGTRTYSVSVSGALDLASNRMTPISGHVFTTLDNIPPVVSGITPISGSIDNILAANVVVTLSEATSGTANGTLSAPVVRLYKSGTVANSFAGVNTLDSTRTIITFNPSADLDPDEHYEVGVSGIMDVSGNTMAAAGRVSGHRFVTAGGPIITATNPVSGQSGVSLNSNIVVTFNKVISGTLNGTITAPIFKLWVSSASPVALAGANTLNGDGTQLTFNPTADLLDSKTYVYAISGIRDTSGFVITQTQPPRSGYTFNTIIVDATPPTVTTTVPANNTQGVLTTTTYVVNFSETVSGTIGQTMPTYIVKVWISGESATTQAVAGTTVLTTATQMTFTPTASLSGNKWYRASVSGAYDIATPTGNRMTPISGIGFKTVDDIAPIITSIAPSNNQTNVTISDNIIVTLNEVCSGTLGGSINSQVISLVQQDSPGVLLGGAITLSADGKVFTFNPTTNFNYNKVHAVNVSGIRDLSDNFCTPLSNSLFTSQSIPLTTVYDYVGNTERPFGNVSPVIVRAGEKRDATGSALNGVIIKRASFALKRVGSPGGIVHCRIRGDTEGSDTIAVEFDTTYASSAISTTKTRYPFEKLANTYALTTNDAVLIEITGATQNGSNYISVYYDDTDPYDGPDSQYISYDDGYSGFSTRDVDAKFET